MCLTEIGHSYKKNLGQRTLDRIQQRQKWEKRQDKGEFLTYFTVFPGEWAGGKF